MMPLIFAFISYLGWGVGDVFGTIVSRKIGAYSATVWTFIAALFIFSPVAFLSLADLHKFTWPLLALNISLGLLILVGTISFNESLRTGNPALVGTISASFTALTVVLSTIFLKEPLNPSQLVALVVIFAGLILSGVNLNQIKRRDILSRSVFFAFMAMVLWGIFYTFIKIPVREVGWFWPNYLYLWLFPVILLAMKFNKSPLAKPTTPQILPWIILNTLFLGTAEYSYSAALRLGNVSVAAPIAGAYPTLFVILALIFFKDPISKQQLVGVITTLVGIVLLSFFSI